MQNSGDKNDKNIVEVVIGGEVFKLISAHSQEHIHRVAKLVNEKISEVHKNGSQPTINTFLNSMYITINIADECISAMEECEKLTIERDTYLAGIEVTERENMMLKQKVSVLENNLYDIKNELAEYINTFDKADTK